ncbi:hypothetical protein C8J56DRAFT_1029180 [Mycena floridula]|nr:hypothetical protein C8J56DRAFT_1029180 [Mycena floridula]
MVQAVSEWLSRSDSRPLDILLTESSEFPAEKPTKNAGWEEMWIYSAYNYYGGDFNFVDHRKPRQAAPFVKAIVQYAARWREVTLGLNLDSAGEEGPVEAELKVLQSKDVPLLTDFVYESSGAYQEQREFADEDFNGEWDADPIQQSQLVQLNLNHMWGASYFVGLRPALLSFLAGCASLEVLVLVGRAEQYMADASTTRHIQVTLKHLHTFSIWMPAAYSVAYFGVTRKIQHFPQLISQWISLWNEEEVMRVTELYLLVSESFNDANDNGGENDDGDDERDELGDAKQIKEAPNNQNNN